MAWHSRIGAAVHYHTAIRRLEDGLKGPLPGDAARQALAPWPRREWPADFDPSALRHAAGLLLVFPTRDRAHIILTVRADTLGRHRGQVSLPGGVLEPGETFRQAALREAHEEIGLEPDTVRVLGALTPLDIPVSGFRLHPIVATTESGPTLTAADSEVATILDVAVADLFDPSRLATTRRVREGRALTVPAFRVAGVEIWGATAMVLAEFLAVIGGDRQI